MTTEFREEYIDVIKVQLGPETQANRTQEELERMVEKAAARQVIKNFGFTGAPYRVDVLAFSLKASKRKVLFQRVIQNGVMRELS